MVSSVRTLPSTTFELTSSTTTAPKLVSQNVAMRQEATSRNVGRYLIPGGSRGRSGALVPMIEEGVLGFHRIAGSS